MLGLIGYITYQICFAAPSWLIFPSVAIASRTWSAIPSPALPAPKTTIRRSLSFCLLTCRPDRMAARVTQPVPWTSSLKQAKSGRYRSRIFLAINTSMSENATRLGQRVYTVGQTKVLKVDVGLGVELPGRLHKCVDKLGVLFTANTLLFETKI